MPKSIPDAIIDAQLTAAEGDVVNVCAGAPTTFTEATVTNQLASQAVTGANFTKANGDTSGRKNTIAPAAGTNIDNNGTADHVVVTNAGDSSIRQITTCTPQALVAGGTVDIGAYDHEIADPT